MGPFEGLKSSDTTRDCVKIGLVTPEYGFTWTGRVFMQSLPNPQVGQSKTLLSRTAIGFSIA